MYKKEYYRKNRQKILAQRKEYRERNRQKILAKAKEYYAKNRDRILARDRKYKKELRERNQDLVNQRRREYYRRNREKILQQQRERDRERKREKYAEMGQLRKMLNSKFIVGINEEPRCPKCLSGNVVFIGRPLKRYRLLQKFRCFSCGCQFTNGDGYVYPKEVRQFVILEHRKGTPISRIVNEIKERFHVVVGHNTIRDWIRKFYSREDDLKAKYRLSLNISKEGEVGVDQVCDICGGRIVYDSEFLCSKCGVVHKSMNEIFEERMKAFLYFEVFQEPKMVMWR